MHDIDFEMWPELHCKKAPEILKAVGCDDDLIHSICSHGYGVCTDTEPIEIMEKVLFASDELTGLIWSTSLMHPGKSIQDIELKSVRKKFKDKRFATGCSRKVIASGAERLGWDLDTLIQKTITAMKNCEKSVESHMRMLFLEL